MSLRHVQTRHVYVSAAVAFALLVGYEGARMAAGHDPALGSPLVREAPPAAPEPAEVVPLAPDDGQATEEIPQPESRLS